MRRSKVSSTALHLRLAAPLRWGVRAQAASLLKQQDSMGCAVYRQSCDHPRRLVSADSSNGNRDGRINWNGTNETCDSLHWHPKRISSPRLSARVTRSLAPADSRRALSSSSRVPHRIAGSQPLPAAPLRDASGPRSFSLVMRRTVDVPQASPSRRFVVLGKRRV